MSHSSSNAAEWPTRLDVTASRLSPPEGVDHPHRPDDPRLGQVIDGWQGDLASLRPGRAVLVGFPQDEGVRRNGGRPGAARAPAEIRRWLHRLTPWDATTDTDLGQNPPLDIGDIRITGGLEESQSALADVLSALLQSGVVPIVLGGGHETAYGHYLGYVQAQLPVGIANVDAHLDVRPLVEGQGHSGTPFRQALEHPTTPLPGSRYLCVGVQPHSVARDHWRYAQNKGAQIALASTVRGRLPEYVRNAIASWEEAVYLSVDADVVHVAEVPGVSAPNSNGLNGEELISLAREAGLWPGVRSFDLVEINPVLDRDGQSARWAALVVWNFLIGLGQRHRTPVG